MDFLVLRSHFNPYYQTTVTMMRADLEKIRPLIEASTTETQKNFGQKFIPICRIICLLYAL
jgi:hypothetical protein